MFQFGGLVVLFMGLSSPKPPVATGLSRLWTKVEQAVDHTTFFLQAFMDECSSCY